MNPLIPPMNPSALQITAFCVLVIVGTAIAYYRRAAVLCSKEPIPLCAHCGYSLFGHQLPDVRCPECGKNLTSEEIIAHPDHGRAFLRRKLIHLGLLFILFALGSPRLLPGYNWTSVICGATGPVSNTYRQIDLQPYRSQWFVTAFVPMPGTTNTRHVMVRLSHDADESGAHLMVYGDTGRYAPFDQSDTPLSVDPIDAKALLGWMAQHHTQVDSEQVRREAEYVVAYLKRMIKNDYSPPPNEPFEFAGRVIDLSALMPNQRPVWLVCLAAVLAGGVWFLGARRITRRALWVASLAGPHGRATGRYGPDLRAGES